MEVGTEELRRRLKQQQWHWRQAASVQDGRAPAQDPDAYRLRSCEPGLRVYDTDPPTGKLVVKRLQDGWWRMEMMREWEWEWESEPPRLGLNHEPPLPGMR